MCFYDFHMVPKYRQTQRFYIWEAHPWLQKGFSLSQPSDFHSVV